MLAGEVVECAGCGRSLPVIDAHDDHDPHCTWPADECTCTSAPRAVCFDCCPLCQRGAR